MTKGQHENKSFDHINVCLMINCLIVMDKG